MHTPRVCCKRGRPARAHTRRGRAHVRQEPLVEQQQHLVAVTARLVRDSESAGARGATASPTSHDLRGARKKIRPGVLMLCGVTMGDNHDHAGDLQRHGEGRHCAIARRRVRVRPPPGPLSTGFRTAARRGCRWPQVGLCIMERVVAHERLHGRQALLLSGDAMSQFDL